MSEPKILVTLIHGTWAAGAAWTRQDSLLCRELKIAFGEGLVIRPPFKWSGRNSVFARRKAASDLIQEIRDTRKSYPLTPHFLIAHSHGGNVALYATEEQEIRDSIAGIACVSTPFLHARARKVEAKAIAWGLVSIVSMSLITLTLLGRISILLSWVTILFASFAALGLASLMDRVIRSYSDTVRLVVRHIEVTADPNANLKIFKAVGDEALFGLGLPPFLQQGFADHFYRRIDYWESRLVGRPATQDRPLNMCARIFWVLGLIGFPIFVVSAILPVQSTILQAVGLYVGILSVICLCLALFASFLKWFQEPVMVILRALGHNLAAAGLLLTLPLTAVWVGTLDYARWAREVEQLSKRRSLLQWFKDWGFGLLIAMLIEVNAEVTPAGEWPVSQFPKGEGNNLAHSAYDNPKATEALVNWLQDESERGISY